MKKILFLILLLFSGLFLQAQDTSAYKKALFISGHDTLRYRIMYPSNYEAGHSYPLVVFLHGAGERGNDNEKQLWHGADLFLGDSVRKKFPAIVVFPQCPTDSSWSRFTKMTDTTTADVRNRALNTYALTTPERLVKLLINKLVRRRVADKNRIYLGGLSLGGFGVYDLVIHYPKYFAAAFTISAQANVKLYTQKARYFPIWIFHGDSDNTISVQPDRDLYKAMQGVGAKNVKYTEYPGVQHNSWDNAFAEPKLLPWLFSFRKGNQ
ncbi:alpha/beta hydrolase-fold protein [Mucilaginibacter dorajii]|uniref:Dienelactone hydrolase family protein n=1 Tax=Mucilaginibacter dorajii TaxID=692994 RepID=A0ABP7R1Q8_9SPHI|nr:alpha/beta hydrolase-fold protein [Mucilaginibacter dorajii]MCS3732195.1 putative peptidase [Mucilaginibacter dorajii]